MKMSYSATIKISVIEAEIEKINILLDEEIQRVQLLLQNKKKLDDSLINNDLVYLFNEMLTLSYSLKLWTLDGLLATIDHPEEFLSIVRDQFSNILCLTGQSEKEPCKKIVSNHCIQPYQRLDWAV